MFHPRWNVFDDRRFQNYSIIVLYTHREIQVKFTIEAADNKIVSKNT